MAPSPHNAEPHAARSARPGTGLRPSRKRSGWRGFTLLEILVAMAVLSIALMTIYQSFASTVHINTATRGLWKAMLYVHSELGRIERGNRPSVSIEQGEFSPDHAMAGYAWKREVMDEEPFPSVKVRKVQLEVSWDAAGSPQSYRSEIYVQPF